ncbi:MAG: cupredoxin domain-containing protein [Vicinamibacterales bacterium]
MLELLGLPVQASQHASGLDQLLTEVHWLMAVMFIGWATLFLLIVVRFRSGAHPKADYVGTRGWGARLAVGIVAAEAFLIIFHAWPVWATRTPVAPSSGEATVVRVVAEQFAWNVHYPGADGRFGRTSIDLMGPSNPLGLDRTDPFAVDDVATINQLVLPQNRTVLIRLSSKDVIHSFWIPEMRVKHDVVPGLEATVWFTPTREGEYEIVCSQLCGLAHYRMRSAVSVRTVEQFEAFLAQEVRSQTR